MGFHNKWIRMIVLGLIVMVSINLSGCYIITMMSPSPGPLETGLSDEAIKNLVNDELVKIGAHRSDLLGIDGPVRSIQAGDYFWLPHGSRLGFVLLSILPSNNSSISKPIILAQNRYKIKLIKKGVVEIVQHLKRDEIVDVVAFAMMTEQAVMAIAKDRILALPMETETIRRGWFEALEGVDFTYYYIHSLGCSPSWRFWFSKSGKIPSAVGDRIVIDIDTDTLEMSSIFGVDTIESARAAIASVGFDASQAEIDIIYPNCDRRLPLGITRDLQRSHLVIRAMGVEGFINPLWITVEKNTKTA